jgi:hypothetical protein
MADAGQTQSLQLCGSNTPCILATNRYFDRMAMLRPAICIAAILMLLGLTAMRMTTPGLRYATRAVVTKTVHRQHTTRRFAASRVTVTPPQAPTPALPRLMPFVWTYWSALVAVLKPQRIGTFALGTGSVARARRWAVLGGHGRHGAG